MCAARSPSAFTRSDLRWTARRLLTAAFLLFAAGYTWADASSVKETQIKCAFLYNFAKYVEWPEGRFANDAEPIVVGLFGDSLLQDELETTVRNRKVNGHPILVRRVITAAEVRATHILFVAASEDLHFATIRKQLGDDAVLMVGESPAFLSHGGSIRFVIDDERLRFEINAGAAERAHLKISSQLQKLATIVHRDM